jgi:hypothetical protein
MPITLEVFNKKIANLYEDYNNVVKPLISAIEVSYEKFPDPLLNEIRAFTDHIARCFFDDFSNNDIINEIKKAKGHLKRIKLDSFKYLNVYIKEQLEKFDRKYRNVNLSTVNDGQFLRQFTDLNQKRINAVREAKKIESRNINNSLAYYEKAYNTGIEHLELVDNYSWQLFRAKALFITKNRILTFLIWLLGIFLGAIIQANSNSIISALTSFFKNIFNS